MGKNIFIGFGIGLGLILAGLTGRGYASGVVDKVSLESYAMIGPRSSIVKFDVPEVASSYSTYVSYTRPARVENSGYGSSTAVGNYISVVGRNISVVEVGSTVVDSGDHVNKYGGRFYYGHNTDAVFGGLVSMGVGSTFAINYGGVLHNYRVAKVMIFEKNTSNGRLQLNGAGSYMKSVSEARSDGVQYGVSLMTCYGKSYGNGDASHRLVIFANEF